MNRMRKDLKKIRDDLIARQAKPVRLRVAAAMAHHELTGRKRDSLMAREYFSAVADTAHALAQISDVYYVNETNRLLRVPAEDLAQGRFENGGDVLVAPSGTVYRRLSMRRIDVFDGIAALRLAREAVRASAAQSPSEQESEKTEPGSSR